MNLPRLPSLFAILPTHGLTSFAATPVDAAPAVAGDKAKAKTAALKPRPQGRPGCKEVVANGRGPCNGAITPPEKSKLGKQNTPAQS